MLNTEKMLRLPEAARRLPNRPSPSSLWRWCRKGLKGIRLEYRRLGKDIYTSMEALERFAKALAEADEVVAAPPPREQERRQPSNTWARDVLRDFGVRYEPCQSDTNNSPRAHVSASSTTMPRSSVGFK